MIKKLTAITLAISTFSVSAFASVIGTEVLCENSYDISYGTELFERKLYSDQEGVGEQSEYYAVYTPNEDTLPIVTSGGKLFGKKTADEVVKYLADGGMRPMLGINAGYFSLETGVTMGHLISEGRIMSKDSASRQGIGFTEKGEAFIAPLKINVNIASEKGEVGVENVNKYNVATIGGISLYTKDVGESFTNEAEAVTVILDVGDKELKFGEAIEATVKSKENIAGDVTIGEGEMALAINVDGSYEYHYNLMNSLEEGDEITITAEAEGDERWNSAHEAIASVGETLIEGGNIVCDVTNGAAPRTAVGITEKGEVIFYVIDGRQKGYSYGAQLRTLAKRMAELGCVEAVNLDGGGSTSISGIYPGAEEISVMNAPSDGRLRKVANFIFLKNTAKPTGILKEIYTAPHGESYLSGTSVTFESRGVDTAYHALELSDVEYMQDGESVIIGNTITFKGNSKVTVTAKSGSIESKTEHYVYDTPKILVKANGKEVLEIKTATDTMLDITADAYIGHKKLIAGDGLITMSIEGDIGTLEDGVFTASAKRTTEGKLVVTAGNTVAEIPVTVENDSKTFDDISEHWARPMIEKIAELGAISGYIAEDGMVFKPDSSITRAEFAVMLARYLKLTDTDYEEAVFADELPEWAKSSINALYSLGYVSGRTNDEGGTEYAPNEEITRAETAAIIGRSAPYLEEEIELSFTDVGEIPTWAKGYIARLAAKGVISGYVDNTVKPHSSVTRAEAATILYKLASIKFTNMS